MAHPIEQVSEHVAMLQRSGASDDQIVEFLGRAGYTLDQYVAEIQRAQTGAGAAPDYNMAQGLLGQFNQGLTFGFADEMQAGVQALLEKAQGNPAALAEIYRYLQQANEAGDANFAAENPNAAALAAGTGGAVTAAATLPAGVAATGARAAGQALPSAFNVPARLAGANGSAAERVGAATFMGGVGGAAAGAGGAPAGSDVVSATEEGALLGAGIGGAFGTVLDPLADYVLGVIRGRNTAAAGARAAPGATVGAPPPAKGATSASVGAGGSSGPPSRPVVGSGRSRGLNKALDQILADRMTPADMLGAKQAAEAAGQPMSPVELAAPGGNLQGTARALVTLPGDARIEAGSTLLGPQARPSAQRGRIENQLQQVAGRPIPTQAQLDTLGDANKLRRRADYRDAYGQGVIDDPTGTQGIPRLVEQLESRPVYREKWEAENAQRARAGNRNDPYEAALPPLFDEQGRVVRAPTVQDIDMIKKGLDTEVYGAGGILTPETAAAKANVGRLEGARVQLLQETDARAPKYANARARAGTDFEQERAEELASSVFTSELSPAEVAGFLRTASAPARQMFEASLLRAASDQLIARSGSARVPSLVRDIWENGDGRLAMILREVYGKDADAFARFEAAMNRELTKVDTRNFLFGGSNTVNKLAEVADLNGGDLGAAAGALVAGGPQAAATSVGARYASGLAQRAQAGFMRGTRDAMTPLFRADEEADNFLRMLEDLRQQRLAAQANSPFIGAAGLGAGSIGAGP